MGSTAMEASIVIFSRNWADFETPEMNGEAYLAKAFGEEEAAKITAQFYDACYYQGTNVARFIPELSVLINQPEQ